MLEQTYFDIRNSIGNNTRVIYHGGLISLIELPQKFYDLKIDGKTVFARNQTPITIPFALMNLARERRMPIQGLAESLSRLNIEVVESSIF